MTLPDSWLDLGNLSHVALSDINSIPQVIYTVSSNGGPVATAVRTVVVQPVCDPGTHVCNDGSCSLGECF